MSTDTLQEALERLLKYAERQECVHEETERQGFIWTVCRMCHRKWADDEGGFQPYREPEEFEQARAALQQSKTSPEPTCPPTCERREEAAYARGLEAGATDAREQALEEALRTIKGIREPYNSQAHIVEAVRALKAKSSSPESGTTPPHRAPPGIGAGAIAAEIARTHGAYRPPPPSPEPRCANCADLLWDPKLGRWRHNPPHDPDACQSATPVPAPSSSKAGEP